MSQGTLMDLIQNCFDEKYLTFTLTLLGVGFSPEQARRFMPLVAMNVSPTLEHGDTALTIRDLISRDPAHLLTRIDIDAVAEGVGISGQKVSLGIDAIAPLLSDTMLRKKDAIVEAIITLSWRPEGGMTDAAKQIFH